MKNYKETQESIAIQDRITDTLGGRVLRSEWGIWIDFWGKWQLSSHLGDLGGSYRGVHFIIIQ